MIERYLDDFAVGERFTTAGVTLTDGQIIDFALRYDPQPFHLDKEAAKDSVFGGLVASGIQTMALTFRLFHQTGIIAACNMAAPGLEDVKFLKPVRAGDTLHVEIEVLEVHRSTSKPDRGTLRLRYVCHNQRGEDVFTMIIPHIARRQAA